MPDYWLDSASLMTPKDGAYAFQLLPQFWQLIEDKAKVGVISSSTEVTLPRFPGQFASWTIMPHPRRL
jgi:hypothetical protein